MPDSSILEEIKLYKTQLDDLLSKKYTDPTLLLGLNNVVQSKFESWIITDCNDYYYSATVGPGQKEFSTIKFLETLWSNFHYPVIKFFQLHHANYYNSLVKDLERSKSKDSFKPKPVEIRKINDSFIKFVKRLHVYYMELMKHFSTFYHNPLIPHSFLKYFELKVPSNAIQVKDSDIQANFLFLVHKCLLHLGNISRHRSFIEISYVLPCLSLKYFHRFRLMKDAKKKEITRPYYLKAIDYYKFCILLLPALNEPYNHLGVLCNFMGDKTTACYWFLRSQFTRVPTYKLGLSNLNSLFKKKSFLTILYEILIESNINEFASKFNNRKGGLSMGDELDVMLLCLIGYYYMPEFYKLNKVFIMRKLKYNKVEFVFLNLAFNVDNFLKLILENNDDGLNFYTKQLVLLMCFNKLVSSSHFVAFIFRYIEMFLDCIKLHELSDSLNANVLINLRLILHWIKEDSYVLKKFQTCNQGMLSNLISVLNNFLEKYEETSEVDSSHPSSHGSKVSDITELLSSGSRPIRNYYFKEDVLFKDFSIIKFQFKDFKDDHLFDLGDIDLLDNDYSALLVNGYPFFLDNNAFIELEKMEGDTSELIQKQVLKHENLERKRAVLIMAKKLIVFENKYSKVEFNNKFLFTKKEAPEAPSIKAKKQDRKVTVIRKPEVQEKATRAESNVQIENTIEEIGVRLSSEETDEDTGNEEEEIETVDDGVDDIDSDASSIDEIESFILRHTTQLQHQMKEDNEIPLSQSLIRKQTILSTRDSGNNSSSLVNLSFVQLIPSDSALYHSTPIFHVPLHSQAPYGAQQLPHQQPYAQFQYNQTAVGPIMSQAPLSSNTQMMSTPMLAGPTQQVHPAAGMGSIYTNYGLPQVVGTPQQPGFPQSSYSVNQAASTPYNYAYPQKQLYPHYQASTQATYDLSESHESTVGQGNSRN